MRFVRLLTLALVLASSGCSLLINDATPTPMVGTHGDPYPANPMGTWDAVLTVDADPGGLTARTVDEALDLPRDGDMMLVRGALFVDDAYGQVWLCSRAELSPDTGGPLCAGANLLVADESLGSGLTTTAYIAQLLALAEAGDLQRTGTIRWAADALVAGRIQ
jgi:hypothetical protein